MSVRRSFCSSSGLALSAPEHSESQSWAARPACPGVPQPPRLPPRLTQPMDGCGVLPQATLCLSPSAPSGLETRQVGRQQQPNRGLGGPRPSLPRLGQGSLGKPWELPRGETAVPPDSQPQQGRSHGEPEGQEFPLFCKALGQVPWSSLCASKGQDIHQGPESTVHEGRLLSSFLTPGFPDTRPP